ncbi:MAG: GNAT family N-acetyltransferase [Bacteroidetes bacterium]|nr:GNAT family N-acetyltransferase [Bacteroidota bacterium]
MNLHFPAEFPLLKTKRLLLRAVHDRDSATVFHLYSNEKVMHQRGEPLFESKNEALQKIFYWRKLFATGNGIRWGIEFTSTKKLIGTIGMKKIFHQHFRADIGYELDPAWWNRGIMTEAVKAITDFGFEKMKLHSFEANITPGHIASQRVLEKIGFKNEAHFRENYFYQGWWDSGIWSLRKK